MQKRKLPKIVFATVVALLGTASAAWCDSFSLSLIGIGGGGGLNVYEYGITVPTGGSITFNNGQTITLTGLSGVVGNDVACCSGSGLYLAWAALSFTSDTATFLFGVQGGSLTYTEGTIGTFLVDSAAPLGTVNWTGQTSAGTFSGTVGGPVAPVPEPNSLLLVGTGLLALGLLARRRVWSPS